MAFSVLPLRAIIFQILFLLVAIAIESLILRQELKLVPRQALQYAASLNLFTTGIGWFMLVNLEALLPDNLRQEIMNLIFFGRWSQSMVMWMVVAGFAVFFFSFVLKVFGLSQLQFLLMTPQEWAARQEQINQRYRLGVKRLRPPARANAAQASALLKANALSYSALSLVLLVRLLLETPIAPSP